MGIHYNEDKKTFKINTNNTTYMCGVVEGNIFAHLYYGERLKGEDIGYVIRYKDRGFSGNPEEFGGNRGISLDTIPQEYPGFNVGDYRTSAIKIKRACGSSETDFRYASYKIYKGKHTIPGLPATYGEDGVDTLEITLRDKVTNVVVVLSYSAFEEQDIITRNVIVHNNGNETIELQRAMSLAIDFSHSDYELIDLYGRYGMERMVQRNPLHHGKQSVDSMRGASSHHHNPFLALVSPNTTEDIGVCYGFNLIYSGNFLNQIEVDQLDTARLVMGINPEDFIWIMEPDQRFYTPEVAMVYTSQGIGKMSQLFHDMYRSHLCRGPWKDKVRPVLINNWEATYFDFDQEKILNIARAAGEIGIDLMVLDDGWFGKRNSDLSGLGDWVVNEKKLQGGLGALVTEINNLGMKFGIWIEPEMISEDSDLYRAHPDWCIHAPDRYTSLSRGQLVLDLSREEVVDHIYQEMVNLLKNHKIEYVKWDMNRHLAEVSSFGRAPKHQRETWHRFMLGVYDLMERLTSEFPEILFEGCSGGGGRFDAGMLYYFPQIWVSDNTDAMERLEIQYGTSLAYPVCTMGAHVSMTPNHQTKRNTPLYTRGIVAMHGTFGYELDLEQVSDSEKEEMKDQIKQFKKDADIILQGDYYRILNPNDKKRHVVYSFVSKNKEQVIVSGVKERAQANDILYRVLLKGLNGAATYVCEETQEHFLGDTLMKVGINIPFLEADGQAFQYHYTAMNKAITTQK